MQTSDKKCDIKCRFDGDQAGDESEKFVLFIHATLFGPTALIKIELGGKIMIAVKWNMAFVEILQFRMKVLLL